MWSKGTSDQSTRPLQPVTAMFDGELDGDQPNGYGSFWGLTNGDSATFTFADPIDIGSGVRIYIQSVGDSGNYGTFKVNGVTQSGMSGKGNSWHTVTGISGTLDSIYIDNTGSEGTEIRGVEVNGLLLIDGSDPGPYNTLDQTWEEWATFGVLLYDENHQRVIAASDALKTYGTAYSLPVAGVQPLVEQPSYPVAAYVQQEDGRYEAIESAAPTKAALASTQETLASTQNDLDETTAQLEKTQDVTKQLIESNLAFRNQLRKEGIAPDRTFDIKYDDLGFETGVVLPALEEEEKPPKRARNEDGTYRADDPSTPDVNEAWEGGKKGKRGRKRANCSQA